MFGFGKKPALTEHVRLEIYAVREICEREGKIDARSFWGDPYLVGYANGVHSALCEFNGVKLSTLEKGRMWLAVVQGNEGQPSEVMHNIEAWSAGHPDFERGAADGINTKLLQLGKMPPKAYDADMTWAISQAPTIQKEVAANARHKAPDLYLAASIALAHRYITKHLDTAYR